MFLIKHLLILREQIAPFDVDFTVRELSLDFSNMKTAAYGLLSKSARLFSLNSNNALLEFLLEVCIPCLYITFQQLRHFVWNPCSHRLTSLTHESHGRCFVRESHLPLMYANPYGVFAIAKTSPTKRKHIRNVINSEFHRKSLQKSANRKKF